MPFRKPVRPLPADHDDPSGNGPPAPSLLVPPCVDAVLMSSVETLCAAAIATADPLVAEALGSDASGIWWMPSGVYGAPGADFERRIGHAYAAALDLRGGTEALAALRALQVGGAPGIADAVAPTAARMAGRGVADPSWWHSVCGLRAVRAAELSAADDGHRSRITFVELERRGTRMTLGVLTDAGAAGVAASIGVFESLDRIRAALRTGSPGRSSDAQLRPLPVPDARHRVLRAVERTDLLGTTDDHGPGYVAFRGLALRWMAVVGADADADPAASSRPDDVGRVDGAKSDSDAQAA
ncbi:MAG: hypothetical protein ITG02_04870 [Patulibacter sp.]|nr:hypothetical protein [Patulibacter sp.]